MAGKWQESESVVVMLDALKKLEAILEAEMIGAPFDCHEAVALMEILTDSCPEIANSLGRIAERFGRHMARQRRAVDEFVPRSTYLM